MSAFAVLAWGVTWWAALFAVGAGWAVALVGPRLARLWPALAPVLGLAVLVVATDVPAFFFGARTWAWPVLGLLLALSAALAFRNRQRVAEAGLAFVPFTVGALVLGLVPQLDEGLVTTLSRGNHDYAFYQALAESLLVRGYGDWGVDLLSAPDTTAWVLRHGGWRSGLTHLSAAACAVTGRPAWAVDGVLWAAVYATLPGALLVSLGLLKPNASRTAQLAVAAAGALGSGPLMLLRDTFASHLAPLPLLVLLAAALVRALAGGRGARWFVVLALAASLSVLPDGGPLVFVVMASVAWMVARERPALRVRIVERSLRFGALAVALIPCAVARVAWQLESLAFTGYLGARGASTGGKDVLSGDVLQLVPTLLGVGTRSWLLVRADGPLFIVAVAVGCVAGVMVLSSLQRARGLPAALAKALALSYLGVLAVLQLTEKQYPAWKTALSMSVFVPLLLGLALELATRPRRALAWCGVYLAALGVVGLGDETRPDTRVGIRKEHVERARRLEAIPGELFLVGNLGGERTLRWELPLQLLLSAQGRHLHLTPHPYSYFRLSAPTRVPDGRGEEIAISLSSANADVEGELLFQTGPVEVRRLAGPGARALNFGFDAHWYEPERDPERRFRWSRGLSRVLADFRGEGCWVFEAHALVANANLVVRRGETAHSFPLTSSWQTYRLPGRGVTTSWLDFEYQGPIHHVDGESRELRFALAEPRWVPGCR